MHLPAVAIQGLREGESRRDGRTASHLSAGEPLWFVLLGLGPVLGPFGLYLEDETVQTLQEDEGDLAVQLGIG